MQSPEITVWCEHPSTTHTSAHFSIFLWNFIGFYTGEQIISFDPFFLWFRILAYEGLRRTYSYSWHRMSSLVPPLSGPNVLDEILFCIHHHWCTGEHWFPIQTLSVSSTTLMMLLRAMAEKEHNFLSILHTSNECQAYSIDKKIVSIFLFHSSLMMMTDWYRRHLIDIISDQPQFGYQRRVASCWYRDRCYIYTTTKSNISPKTVECGATFLFPSLASTDVAISTTNHKHVNKNNKWNYLSSEWIPFQCLHKENSKNVQICIYLKHQIAVKTKTCTLFMGIINIIILCFRYVAKCHSSEWWRFERYGFVCFFSVFYLRCWDSNGIEFVYVIFHMQEASDISISLFIWMRIINSELCFNVIIHVQSCRCNWTTRRTEVSTESITVGHFWR